MGEGPGSRPKAAIDPGSGAYNLACIAANLGDYEAVERWLTRAAEFGKVPTLSHTLRDVNFADLLGERRFRDLLDSIYGWPSGFFPNTFRKVRLIREPPVNECCPSFIGATP